MSKPSERKSVKPNEVHGGEAGAIAGEVLGGLLGSAAGPPGVVAGMVIGAVAGTLAGESLDADARRKHLRDEELDEAIGVVGGDLGAARPDAPPAKRGAPSSASSGVAALSGPAPAEGPMQNVDED